MCLLEYGNEENNMNDKGFEMALLKLLSFKIFSIFRVGG